MITLERFPNIGLVAVRPTGDAFDDTFEAIRRSDFMRREVHGPVYEEELGLINVDPDPPSGTPGDVQWRVDALPKYGGAGKGWNTECIAAYTLTDTGEISPDLHAVQALLVVKKKQISKYRSHVIIEELDVARDLRATGFAPDLLSQADVKPGDNVTLEVADTNTRAQRFWEKLGFIFTTDKPVQHGIYAVWHLKMAAPGATYLMALGRERRRYDPNHITKY